MVETYRPHDIEIKNFVLLNYRNKYVDIRHVMVEFTIFHDIFANGLECEIVIVDSNGLIEMLPIVGDETAVITFKTPTFDDYRTYTFRIYKVSDRTNLQQRSDAYVLYGCSQEIINSYRFSVNKSYKDLSADKVVKAIYNSFLKPVPQDHYAVKEKNISIQETLGNCHFVFSGEEPMKAINYICKEAEVKSTGLFITDDFNNKQIKTEEIEDTSLASNFVFYESYDGWNFRTIDSLFNQTYVKKDRNNKEITRDYFEDFYLTDALRQMSKNLQEKVSQHQVISSIDYEKQFDNLERLKSGLYYHTVETIDPITKTFTSESFNFDKDQNNINHLEKDRKLYSHESIFGRDSNTSVKYYMISNIGSNYSRKSIFANAINDDPQIRNPRRIHNWFKYDYVSRLQLNNIVVSIGIPGNTDIEIGQVINLHIPQLSGIEEYKRKENLMFGNRFFITAVRHTYNKEQNSFFTVFECVKDTYAKKILEESRDLIPENESVIL